MTIQIWFVFCVPKLNTEVKRRETIFDGKAYRLYRLRYLGLRFYSGCFKFPEVEHGNATT
ncbi:MAG: hypothetical protein LBJ00_05270 [Planctomycetaceae bacterium]|nr:hypothetical protein [Planctomycetaceae bacterium]